MDTVKLSSISIQELPDQKMIVKKSGSMIQITEMIHNAIDQNYELASSFLTAVLTWANNNKIDLGHMQSTVNLKTKQKLN